MPGRLDRVCVEPEAVVEDAEVQQEFASVDEECPPTLTALRQRALIDSIAFVVQITRRISTSYSWNGRNPAQEDSQSRTIAGYR